MSNKWKGSIQKKKCTHCSLKIRSKWKIDSFVCFNEKNAFKWNRKTCCFNSNNCFSLRTLLFFYHRLLSVCGFELSIIDTNQMNLWYPLWFFDETEKKNKYSTLFFEHQCTQLFDKIHHKLWHFHCGKTIPFPIHNFCWSCWNNWILNSVAIRLNRRLYFRNKWRKKNQQKSYEIVKHCVQLLEFVINTSISQIIFSYFRCIVYSTNGVKKCQNDSICRLVCQWVCISRQCIELY